jgi:aminopeptidase N
MRGHWLGFVCLAALAACQPSPAEPSDTFNREELNQSAADPPNARGYDARSYELDAHFDWARQRLIGVEHATLVLRDVGRTTVEFDSAVQVSQVSAQGHTLPFTVGAATLQVDISPLRHRERPITLEIDFEAPTAPSLHAALGGEDGNRISSRVVFTDSEPDRGLWWLVANHDPSDRARWSVQLTVEGDEDVIANGERVRDQVRDGQRVVRYHLNRPIPTYLMAFAAGQLEHHDDCESERVPLSVWHRRGLPVDSARHLAVLRTLMKRTERLAGPYPWNRYSVVLLPDGAFGGGMENATITFNSESSGLEDIDVALNAHELGHHWFGDWVTVRTFDDLWFKEGLATVLEVESRRATNDPEHTGRLFGNDLFFDTSAIIDRSLTGLDRYTSGPYGRAGWLLTQIRAVVGEARFWAALQAVLRDHALGSIDSETFVRHFGLDPATEQQVLATLEQSPLPALDIATAPQPDGTTVTLTLSDPAGAIIAPPELTVVDAAGHASTSTWSVGQPTTVTVPAGGYVAPDERDVHPEWYLFDLDFNAYSQLAERFTPSSAAALTQFTSRSPGHQEQTFVLGVGPWSADAYEALYRALDSRGAQANAEAVGCFNLAAAARAGGPNPWTPVLTDLLQHSAVESYWPWNGPAFCGPEFANANFGAELRERVADPNVGDSSRLDYLLTFDYGAATNLATFGHVATGAISPKQRFLALVALVYQAQGGTSPLSAEDVPAWQTFFRARLAESTSTNFFLRLWAGVRALRDDGALAIVGHKLHTVEFSPTLQRRVLCQAYTLSKRRPGAWDELRTAAQPTSTLPQLEQDLLADPTACDRPAAAKSLGTPDAERPTRPDEHIGQRGAAKLREG